MKGRGPDAAALAVILLAGALSATWAFLVPIFQAPDEPAHFDYAISIMSAGRLIHVGGKRADWIVSPYAQYLLRATDFERIAWHSSMRVPAGYGSRAYFARLDAGAPSLALRLKGDGGASYVAASYPFGFYALEAVWMAAVSRLTGSLTATFFAARLLCVFLLMCGLYFNYRTALNVGLSKWLAVGFVAVVGLFPLTTFVSSYVQPDNLAYALVSACLFWASRLAKGAPAWRNVAPLGATLGMLAVTKYQFFAAVALPVFGLLTVRLWTQRAPAARTALTAAVCVIPALGLLAVQHWVVAPGGGSMQRLLLANEPSLAPAVRAAAQGFVDCFVSGLCAATYWQVVGWFDTPIVIASWGTEMAIRILISVASIGTLLIVAVRVLRNLIRLARASFRGHGAAAALIGTGDAVFSSYLCFLAIMLALYVLTGNAFGAEGRHFYPFAFAGALCVIWYAPRVLWKKHARASSVAAAALVVYGLLSSAYALAAIRGRYYGTSGAFVAAGVFGNRITDSPALGILRPVEGGEYEVVGFDEPFAFPPGRWRNLRASGIAAFERPPTGAQHVAIVVDGDKASAVLTRQYEVTVAEETRSRAYAYSGFYARLPADLGEGAHAVSAYAQLPSGSYEPVPGTRMFFLTRNGDAFSRAFLEQLRRAPLLRGRIDRLSLCRGALWTAAGVANVAEDSVASVSGTMTVPSRGGAAPWLLVNGKPYPARLFEGNRFFGTIPTAALSPGAYTIEAFALAFHPPRNYRLAPVAQLIVTQAPVGDHQSRSHDPRCSDPLRLLAGTSP